MKNVIYNGGTNSYYGCSDATNLVVGKLYKVIREIDLGFQTNYELEGVNGKYNSVWFTDVESLPQTYLAFGFAAPVEGKSCECYRILPTGSQEHCFTSEVKHVSIVGKNTYKAVTRNSIYIVTIL